MLLDSTGQTSKNIVTTIKADTLAYLVFFADEFTDVGLFELGLAIQTKALIVIIGDSPSPFLKALIDGKKIISAYNWDNFIAQRFFAP